MESRAKMRREEGIKGKMTAYLSHIIMEYIQYQHKDEQKIKVAGLNWPIKLRDKLELQDNDEGPK